MIFNIGSKSRRDARHDPATPALQMQNVSFAFELGANGLGGNGQREQAADRYALEAVTFSVNEGERIAVVGPNGAGKSTMFKLTAGTLKPIAGRVAIFGHEPSSHICIAYVPQRSQIDWTFPVTVEDVVMMGRIREIGFFRWPRRSDHDIVRESLARVNLTDLARKQIGELSGGQQQRVFLARALAQSADLVLLDEPFTGLDVPSHEAILDSLDVLHEDGVTVLVATHDLDLAAERFDRIMLLNRRIVAFGAADAVLTAENLLLAYGGQLRVVDANDQEVWLADSCCDDGDVS